MKEDTRLMMGANLRGELKELPPLELRRYEYKGFMIEEVVAGAGMYAVRRYQQNSEMVHDYKPWNRSVDDAIMVVERLIKKHGSGQP
jgi:hypothetical protein